MKISEALGKLDVQKFNTYDQKLKIGWLSTLDGQLFTEVLSFYEGAPATFTPYTDADLDKQLLVADPYSDLYVKWLIAQTDLANMEITRYNNSLSVFDVAYEKWCSYYNRTHTHKSTANFNV
jgi:hypothetical protein